MDSDLAVTVVGFDTATRDLCVAATRGGECLRERQVSAPEGGRPPHATDLLAEVESAAAAAGGWAGVDVIAVGVGPGSFTGIRIGVATARALAQGLRKPVVPVVSLDALGGAIAEQARASARPVLAAIDASRGEVFAALYGENGERTWGPVVCGPGELADRLAGAGGPLAAGSGSLRFRRELEVAGAEVLPEADGAHRLSARHLCLLASASAATRPEKIHPLYLRRPDAEQWLERDRENTDRRGR